MGLDLRLLVVDGNLGDWGYSHTVISLERDRSLWDIIKDANPQRRQGFTLNSFFARIPDGKLAGETCYGKVVEDCYGKPLTYLTAGELVAEMSPYKRSLGDINLAALAFLEELPQQDLVALYWC